MCLQVSVLRWSVSVLAGWLTARQDVLNEVYEKRWQPIPEAFNRELCCVRACVCALSLLCVSDQGLKRGMWTETEHAKLVVPAQPRPLPCVPQALRAALQRLRVEAQGEPASVLRQLLCIPRRHAGVPGAAQTHCGVKGGLISSPAIPDVQTTRAWPPPSRPECATHQSVSRTAKETGERAAQHTAKQQQRQQTLALSHKSSGT